MRSSPFLFVISFALPKTQIRNVNSRPSDPLEKGVTQCFSLQVAFAF
jgi:hypothetical protein